MAKDTWDWRKAQREIREETRRLEQIRATREGRSGPEVIEIGIAPGETLSQSRRRHKDFTKIYNLALVASRKDATVNQIRKAQLAYSRAPRKTQIALDMHLSERNISIRRLGSSYGGCFAVIAVMALVVTTVVGQQGIDADSFYFTSESQHMKTEQVAH